MRGKSGQWGNPFTKGNANAMRLRGLETRRSRAEKRFIRALCSGEATEMVRPAQIAGPGPSQPNKPPGSDAAKLSPAVEASPARTAAAPVPILQPGDKICYGYETAPGQWVEAKQPPHRPNGPTAADVLRAQRMLPRRWDGTGANDGPR